MSLLLPLERLSCTGQKPFRLRYIDNQSQIVPRTETIISVAFMLRAECLPGPVAASEHNANHTVEE